jgi:MmgE/PrpD N-terminal domain
MTTTTAEVVDLVLAGRPRPDAAERAAGELRLFTLARAAGADSDAAMALRMVMSPVPDPQWQALVDGTAAMAAEHRPAWVAVCAAAAVLGQSPDDTADAVAIGYEVAGRLAGDLAEAEAAGWSLAAVAGRIGAGAAAARALHLPAAAVRDTIGLCATQSAGLARAANAAAELQIGKAAADAIEAALLGRSGFTGPDQPLEGRRGLFALLNR